MIMNKDFSEHKEYEGEHMEYLESICFEIISNAGMARSLFIEAIQDAKIGEFAKAQDALNEGNELYKKSYVIHMDLVHQESEGSSLQMTLLLTHAEDQLMSAESFRILSQEFIDLYKTIKD